MLFTDRLSEISSDALTAPIVKTASIKLTINKCYKLNKGMLFINTKIKKECYGIKIVAYNIDLSQIRCLIIDETKFKAIYCNDDTLFMVGNKNIKSNRTINIPDKYLKNNYASFPLYYKLNDKTIVFNNLN